MDTPTGTGVKSIDRAWALLASLGEAGQPLTVRDLARRTGLPRPTVYRLVDALARHGAVVIQDGTVAVGHRVLWLAGQRLAQLELRAAGRPYLMDLCRQVGETVHLGVLEQGHVVYIDKVEPPRPLRMASTIGAIMPAHSTALGKAMLAWSDPRAVREIVAQRGLPRRTPRTITTLARLQRELAAVRARGFAVDNVENEDGIRCVGAPIFDHRGRVAGAVSISGSVSTISLRRAREELGPRVRETAARISRVLGWSGAQKGGLP
ncbi:MAG: IclR family transcriptional regulator [Armatimonadota bacterium]|nr:IclR family transcriptional regulator [Armatimonadota bacterium]MDR7400886.1 IclR family transcriptional regulator [Armatimonadota bacterium]MDR7404173.1 IclR family transcriptional regulator [Armatimonadota bacterium]MDR7437396.1 IclR family transcriptional regulator [Armatimonadota bacterium]MDR7472788.1 IclR family transcriptional regulator [Armatimonadota bacterium]